MAPGTLGTSAVVARDAIVSLCARDLPPLTLLEQVATRVRRVVPYDAAGWLQMDPATLLHTASYAQAVPPALERALVENEIGAPDVAKFAGLARLARPALALSRATGGELERSARYRELYAPAGLGDELRSAFMAGGACWGTACLTRAVGDRGFTDGDAAFLAGVGPHVAHGLRTAVLLAGSVDGVAGADAPGTALVTDDGRIEALTTEAWRWLDALPASGAGLPIVVAEVASRARAYAEHGRTGPPARARVQLPGGDWLVVHGARLSASNGAGARTAVVLEPARGADVAPLIVAARGLTPREREVAHLLAGALTTDEIAATLAISRHTLRDHAKLVFDKLGVRSRPELTALLRYERA